MDSSVESPRRRTAVITGASLGIGQEYARRLAQAGVRVLVADIADPAQTLALLDDEGTPGIAVRCDVGSERDVAQVRARADELGGADILVHNAGIYPLQPFEEIDLETWRRVQRINVEGLFLLTRALLPGMRRRRWGRIVAISSSMFSTGVPGAVHYVASKGAVVGFVRGLAGEIGAENVTINAISPGLIRSHGTTVGPHDKMGLFEGSLALQAIPRTGQPRDLSDALTFLVSDGAAFVTGQTFSVDGGTARS